MDRQKVLLAGQLELDRPPRAPCELRGDEIGVRTLVLVAESAAHVLADHADLVRREAERSSDIVAAVRDALRRRPDRELAEFPLCDCSARFHLRVVVVLRHVMIFDDDV